MTKLINNIKDIRVERILSMVLLILMCLKTHTFTCINIDICSRLKLNYLTNTEYAPNSTAFLSWLSGTDKHNSNSEV